MRWPLLIQIPPEGLPYALIGQVVVAGLLLGAIIIGLAIALICWYRGWGRVSRWAYDGEDTVPVWRLRVAGIAEALSRFQFHKLPAVYAEAPTLTETTDDS